LRSLDRLKEEALHPEHTHREILGVAGSPRSGGNSDILLDYILEDAAGQEIPAHAVRLRDLSFDTCMGCERCRADKICTGRLDGLSLLYPDIISARGLVLVSPVHNYNITALMKAFIDRLYCFYNFDNEHPRGWSSRLGDQGRKAVIAVVGEQEDPKDMGIALEAMRLPLEALGYDIVGETTVLSTFKRAQIRKDDEAVARARRLGENLAGAMAADPS